jgi:hypothetical protein
LLVFDTDTGSFWFFGGSWKNLSAALADADNDTKIQVEESPDEDVIRFDLGGTESMVLRKNAFGMARLEVTNTFANSFIGMDAGTAIVNGSYNTAHGANALSSLTTSSNNTATGYNALHANINGVGNTAMGNNALQANTTGNHNAALGGSTLFSNTTGYGNVAIGERALYLNPDRSNLVAVGDSALYHNGSVAFFSYQATGNTALGSKCLFSNTLGFENTAAGSNALFSSQTASFNTAFGAMALNMANSDGNTALGHRSLPKTTSGSSNTAVGRQTLENNSTGFSNTAVGANALDLNIAGNSNTAIGALSDVTQTNLSRATAIGYSAKVACSNCLVLGGTDDDAVNVGIKTASPVVSLHVADGTDAGPTNSNGFIMAGLENALNIAIDNNEIMARNNSAASTLYLNHGGGDVKIGNAGSIVGVGRAPITNNLEVEGTASKSSSGSWLANSDARLKKNIHPLDSREMLEKLLALQGVTYEWNDDKTGWKRPGGTQYGFTAQNIQQVFPTLVEEDKLGYLQAAYGTYDAMVVEAIRALKLEIEKSEIHASKLEIEKLKAENAALKAELHANKSQLDKITAALAGAGINVEK